MSQLGNNFNFFAAYYWTLSSFLNISNYYPDIMTTHTVYMHSWSTLITVGEWHYARLWKELSCSPAGFVHLILATGFANLFTQSESAVSLELMMMTSNKENEASLSKYSKGQQWLHSVRKWTEIARQDIWSEACTYASTRVSQVSLTKTGGEKVIITHLATLWFLNIAFP